MAYHYVKNLLESIMSLNNKTSLQSGILIDRGETYRGHSNVGNIKHGEVSGVIKQENPTLLVSKPNGRDISRSNIQQYDPI